MGALQLASPGKEQVTLFLALGVFWALRLRLLDLTTGGWLSAEREGTIGWGWLKNSTVLVSLDVAATTKGILLFGTSTCKLFNGTRVKSQHNRRLCIVRQLSNDDKCSGEAADRTGR